MDTILTIVKLLGGLGLFIYGMKLMGDGLENAAGEGLKKILEKVTKNPIIGVIVGAVVTMVIQSSSATTVMVVGFVNEFSTSGWNYNGGKYWNNRYGAISCF